MPHSGLDAPPNRGALFATVVDNSFKREEQANQVTRRAWIDTAIIRRALAQLVHAMQQSAKGTEMTRAQADAVLEALPEKFDASLLLRLDAGDSLLFDATQPHCFCNPMDEDAVTLLVFQASEDSHLAHQRHLNA